MLADIKAFANIVPSGKIFIFSLQMRSNICIFIYTFGCRVFKNALGKAPKR
jgi:hypothetical protein